MNRVHHRLISAPFILRSCGYGEDCGGVEGNERLTGATAVLLLVLLAVEGMTLLFLRPLLSVHVFVGMLLIPPVPLKLGATGYRFMRYYQRRREYTVKGPPPPIMRFLVAPALVASTIGVLGTGVCDDRVRPPRDDRRPPQGELRRLGVRLRNPLPRLRAPAATPSTTRPADRRRCPSGRRNRLVAGRRHRARLGDLPACKAVAAPLPARPW